MHEWALAQSIVATIADEVEKKGLKEVLKVDVRVGELQQIDLDVFRFVLESVLKTYDLSVDMSRITISKDKSVLKCRVCDTEWSFSESREGLTDDEVEAIHFIPEVAHVYIRCPGCGSPDFDIIRGRGVWIESIEGGHDRSKTERD
jgi:hydrogenase nickel incorporation protein HypA/HybF